MTDTMLTWTGHDGGALNLRKFRGRARSAHSIDKADKRKSHMARQVDVHAALETRRREEHSMPGHATRGSTGSVVTGVHGPYYAYFLICIAKIRFYFFHHRLGEIYALHSDRAGSETSFNRQAIQGQESLFLRQISLGLPTRVSHKTLGSTRKKKDLLYSAQPSLCQLPSRFSARSQVKLWFLPVRFFFRSSPTIAPLESGLH